MQTLAGFRRQWPVLAAGLIVAAALAAVGWIDYRATRLELVALLRDQAHSLRATVAAAVRASHASAVEAERQLGERLLDNARLIRDLDRRGPLDQAALDAITQANRLFWITLYDARGRRELGSVTARGTGPGPGFGPGGGPGGGSGRGAGGGSGRGPGGGRFGAPAGSGQEPGAGSAALLERLLAGSDTEAITELHVGRSGGARVAAGIRRARGGAILLNADASALAEIERAFSLERLLDDIALGSHALAYLVLDADSTRLVHGIDAAALPAAPATPGASTGVSEREVVAGGRPVLEIEGPVEIEGLAGAELRIGMGLEGVRRAERQTLARLAGSLSTALVLTLVAIGFLGLRRQYGELRERHQAAEQALRRRDRLTAMGELASTVAHEVRNPLNAIAMAARRLSREFPGSPDRAPDPADVAEQRDLMGVIEGETRRLDGIVQQFLEVARPPALVRQDVDLAALARDLIEAHRPLAATRSVEIDEDLGPTGRASLDPSQFRQAADNVLRNAIEATPAGRRVRVATRRAGRERVLEVADTGPGIAPDHLPRIFDLYFTTKAGGTGVGLAVAHQVVSAHGGSIEVESRPGQGTRMTIRLPDEEETRG